MSAYQERNQTKQKWTNVNKKLVYIDESGVHNENMVIQKKESVVLEKSGQIITVIGAQKESKSQAMIVEIWIKKFPWIRKLLTIVEFDIE